MLTDRYISRYYDYYSFFYYSSFYDAANKVKASFLKKYAILLQVHGDENQGAVFLREFTLIRRESLNEDFLSDLLNHNHKPDDPVGPS